MLVLKDTAALHCFLSSNLGKVFKVYNHTIQMEAHKGEHQQGLSSVQQYTVRNLQISVPLTQQICKSCLTSPS
jgi:hypothetical protein